MRRLLHDRHNRIIAGAATLTFAVGYTLMADVLTMVVVLALLMR